MATSGDSLLLGPMALVKSVTSSTGPVNPEPSVTLPLSANSVRLSNSNGHATISSALVLGAKTQWTLGPVNRIGVLTDAWLLHQSCSLLSLRVLDSCWKREHVFWFEKSRIRSTKQVLIKAGFRRSPPRVLKGSVSSLLAVLRTGPSTYPSPVAATLLTRIKLHRPR